MNKRTKITAVLMIMVCICIALPLTTKAATNDLAAKMSKFAPVFDATYYANLYPDLKSAFGTDANQLFNHFYNYGMKEGRQGSAEFNVQAYKNRYPDLQAAFGDDLTQYYIHYINTGKAEGRNGKADGSAAVATTTSTTNTTTATTNTTTATTAANAAAQKQIAQKYSYYVVNDFAAIRGQYRSAKAILGYDLAYVQSDGDQIVLSYVFYTIGNKNYKQFTLYDITKNGYLRNPETVYQNYADRTSGREKIAYLNRTNEILDQEILIQQATADILNTGVNTGNGTYVPASDLRTL